MEIILITLLIGSLIGIIVLQRNIIEKKNTIINRENIDRLQEERNNQFVFTESENEKDKTIKLLKSALDNKLTDLQYEKINNKLITGINKAVNKFKQTLFKSECVSGKLTINIKGNEAPKGSMSVKFK